MNDWILRLVMACKTLWIRLGANPDQLEAILRVKLTMDDRKPYTAFGQTQPQKQKKVVRKRSLLTTILFLVVGCFYLAVFATAMDTFTSLVLYFLAFMAILALSLITDFSNLLIDVRDNYIILPRPVSPQTILVVRLLHILIHLSRIVLPMSLPALVYLSITQGPVGGLVFFVDVVFATLLCIFLICAVYLIILRFTTAERFKNIIGGIQVVFTIVVFGSYYIVPRMIGELQLSQAMVLGHRFLDAAPPLWLAALWTVLVHPGGQVHILYGLGAAGLLLPPLSIWCVVRFLGPAFDRKLGALGAGSGSQKAPVTSDGRRKKGPALYQLVSRWVTLGNAEATGFGIAWLLSARNRDFKLKVYPSFAYVFFYFFFYGVMGGRGHSSLRDKWMHLPDTKMYILLIYMSSLAMISAISNLVYSEKYKAAWVYYVSPIKAPGKIQVGAVKAMLVKYFIPFYLGATAFAFYIWGIAVLPDMLLGLANVTWFGMLLGYIYLKKLPFSAHMTAEQGSGRFMKVLFIFIIPAGVGFAHYLLRSLLPNFPWVIFALATCLAWVIYSKYRELSWEELARSEDDF
jgi:ABC-2 type transport system permease protein